MLRRSFIALSLLFAAACLAEPAPELVTYEWAVETSPLFTSLPTKVPSHIDARPCASCKALSLEVTEDTRFFLASGHVRQEVPLAELKKLSRNELTMGVFYRPETLQVTRIVIFGVKAADLTRDGAQR